MATPANEAFIDLENTLTNRLESAWARHWVPISKRIQRQIDAGDFMEAHDIADKIDYGPIVRKNLKMARTVGNAALLLGHTRLTSLDKADISDPQQQAVLDNLLIQFEIILTTNATEGIRKRAHEIIEAFKAKAQEDQEISKANAKTAIKIQVSTAGDGFAAMASSLHVSRLNSFGFLSEAVSQGITHYQVTEVLDNRTCPVCREMDGRVFNVSQGVTHAMTIMQNDDPDSLRQLAPWPSQSQANVASLAGKNSNQLAGEGLSLPPYHANCRGIVTKTTSTTTTSMVATPNVLARELIERAKKEAKRTTRDLKRLAGRKTKSKLVGLKYKVKSKPSLMRKIRDTAVKDEISPMRAAEKINDSLRYTMQVEEARYTQTVTETLKSLEKKGYRVKKFKNTWGVPGEPTPIYQGVNSTLLTPAGQEFELQFHTRLSFHTKEVLNHDMYEVWRLLDTPDNIKLDLFAKMQANQELVRVPVGITELATKPRGF